MEQLKDYSFFKEVVEHASLRTGNLYRFFFSSSLAKVVFQVYLEKVGEFDRLDSTASALLALSQGNNFLFEKLIIPELPFYSFGHILASLAFCSFCVNKADISATVSSGFILDAVCRPAWQKFMMSHNMMENQTGSSEFSLEEALTDN
ncbi:E1B [California sea lion adenovirus 1]|uniref:E1B protein, small T-antigen n=1 Tax=California sea lion adenovirus 1 TaxID=943083 RepID=A0A059XJ33_9ADEN|nr:E1B 19 kDa protein [California sea lion adenovirus 1]AIA22344.1 E1B 19 kDa protein [California sea lion adenovirus 1]QLH64698.1 E1B [California sea lion adenovirus 1]